MDKKIEIKERKSAFVELKDWCAMSMGPDQKDKGHFLEVTEWSNSEGYDLHIYDMDGDRIIQLTWGQFEAMRKCIKAINKDHEKN